jgi:hypothetical protein
LAYIDSAGQLLINGIIGMWESRRFPGVREADLFFSGLEGVAHSNPEQLDIKQLSGEAAVAK